MSTRHVLPGFGLTLGGTMLFTSFAVLIPLGALVLQAGGLSWPAFWVYVSDPRAVATYRVTLFAASAATAAARFTLRFEIDAYNKAGDALARSPDAVTPGAAREFSGAELLANSALRWELGGAELFLAAERLSERPLPTTLRGSLNVPTINGPHGHRAIYLFARERDDAKVWTSPRFVRFTC